MNYRFWLVAVLGAAPLCAQTNVEQILEKNAPRLLGLGDAVAAGG